MHSKLKKLRAIDLYSGIGGWALGLELLNIQVVNSYEWWDSAIETQVNNLGAGAEKVNIRELKLTSLPRNIDIVVGSPPCTQFSYSNRGGGGDINDGLKDIVKFLEVVKYLKPKYWAMENIPRVAKIIEQEIKEGGILAKYRKLFKPIKTIEVINMSQFGLPQKRLRMIAGNFSFDLLKEYSGKCEQKVLADVLIKLNLRRPKDSNYNLVLNKIKVT